MFFFDLVLDLHLYLNLKKHLHLNLNLCNALDFASCVYIALVPL